MRTGTFVATVVAVAMGSLLSAPLAHAESKSHAAKAAKHVAPSAMERETHRHNRRMAQLAKERETAERAGDKSGVKSASKKVAVELKQHAAKSAQIAKAAAKRSKK